MWMWFEFSDMLFRSFNGAWYPVISAMIYLIDGIRLVIPYIPTLHLSATLLVAKSVLFLLNVKKEGAI